MGLLDAPAAPITTARTADMQARIRAAQPNALGGLSAILGTALKLSLFAHAGVNSLASTLTDGDSVTTWQDERGGPYLTATPTTTGSGPKFVQAGWRSMPCLRFGVGQSLTLVGSGSGFGLDPGTGAFTVWVVARQRAVGTSGLGNVFVGKGNTGWTSTGRGWSIFSGQSGSSNPLAIGFKGVDSGSTIAGQTNVYPGGATDAGKLVTLKAVFSGSALAASVNGSTAGVTSGTNGGTGTGAAASNAYAATISSATDMVIGNLVAGSMDVFAVVVAQGTITTAQDTAVSNYLAALYHPTSPPACTAITPFTVLGTTVASTTYYRIPSIINAGGTLVAAMEKRIGSNSDSARIDIVIRRSTDQGKTWGAEQTVTTDGTNTCGNPVLTYDASNGRLWMHSCFNLVGYSQSQDESGTSTLGTRRVFVQYSDDKGATWSARAEITSSVKQASWSWYATGPGHGIQAANGRLIIPADHFDLAADNPGGANNTTYQRSHVIYSDDHGATWQIGPSASSVSTDESDLAVLADGTIVWYMRHQSLTTTNNTRYLAASTDNGQSFSTAASNLDLLCPQVGAGIATDGKNLVALTLYEASSTRQSLAVNVSTDKGATWPAFSVIGPSSFGLGGYSAVTYLGGGLFAALFEWVGSINLCVFKLAYPEYTA